MGGVDGTHSAGGFLRHGESESAGLGTGTEAPEVALGWACSAENGYDVVISTFAMGAGQKRVSFRRATCSPLGGQYQPLC